MKKKKRDTSLSFHRLLFNLFQPLHELFFLTLYPFLLFLCMLSLLLFILQLGPEKVADYLFQITLCVYFNYETSILILYIYIDEVLSP